MNHEIHNTPEFTPDFSSLAFLSGAGGLEYSVLVAINIGKISTFFQPKARVPSKKIKFFEKFLTYFC